MKSVRQERKDKDLIDVSIEISLRKFPFPSIGHVTKIYYQKIQGIVKKCHVTNNDDHNE